MATTLSQRTTEFSRSLEMLRGLNKAAERDAWFRERSEELRNARQRLEEPLAFLRALGAHPELTIAGEPQGFDASVAAMAVEAVRTLAERDPASLLKDKSVQTLKGTLGGVVATAETDAASAWRAVVGRLTPHARPEILTILEQIPAYRDGVKQLRDLQLDFADLANRRWVSGSELELALRLSRDAEAEWTKLAGGEGIPAGVMSFLIACARDGAGLDAVTPAIAEWIEKRGLRDAFRVRFAGG